MPHLMLKRWSSPFCACARFNKCLQGTPPEMIITVIHEGKLFDIHSLLWPVVEECAPVSNFDNITTRSKSILLSMQKHKSIG